MRNAVGGTAPRISGGRKAAARSRAPIILRCPASPICRQPHASRRGPASVPQGRIAISKPSALRVIALGNVPLHLVSPGFSRRDILVCHFEPAAFKALSGFSIDPSAAMLDACRDGPRSPGDQNPGPDFKRTSGQCGRARRHSQGPGLGIDGRAGALFCRYRAKPRRPPVCWRRGRCGKSTPGSATKRIRDLTSPNLQQSAALANAI